MTPLLVLSSFAQADEGDPWQCRNLPQAAVDRWRREVFYEEFQDLPAEVLQVLAAEDRYRANASAENRQILEDARNVLRIRMPSSADRTTAALGRRCDEKSRSMDLWSLDVVESFSGLQLRLGPADTEGLGVHWVVGLGLSTGTSWLPIDGDPMLLPYAYAHDSSAYFDHAEFERVEHATFVTSTVGFAFRSWLGPQWDTEFGLEFDPLALLDFIVGQPSEAWSEAVYQDSYAGDCEQLASLGYYGCSIYPETGDIWFADESYLARAFNGLRIWIYYMPGGGAVAFGGGLRIMDGKSVQLAFAGVPLDTGVVIAGTLSPGFSFGFVWE